MFLRTASRFSVWLIFYSSVHAVSAATLNVPHDYGTIQAAIDAAVDGDVVSVHPGGYSTARMGETFPIRLKSGVDVKGARPELCILDGAGAASVFRGTDVLDVTIEGLTVRHGMDGIRIDGNSEIHVRNCVVDNS